MGGHRDIPRTMMLQQQAGSHQQNPRYVHYDPDEIKRAHAAFIARMEHEMFYGKPVEPIEVEIVDITPEVLALPSPETSDD